VGLIEIEREIIKYKGYIVACRIAISNLNQASGKIDDCKTNLQSSKEDIENGYKNGASDLATSEVNECSIDANVQRDSVTAVITTLGNDIAEFQQKIQELEAARTAEIERLAQVARKVASDIAEAIRVKAEEAASAVADIAQDVVSIF
jgi:chromosome segregation ATPase